MDGFSLIWGSPGQELEGVPLIFAAVLVLLLWVLAIGLLCDVVLPTLKNTENPLLARTRYHRKNSFGVVVCMVSGSLAITGTLGLLLYLFLRFGVQAGRIQPQETTVVFLVVLSLTFLVAVGVTGHLGFDVLTSQPVRLFCPHCGAYHPSTLAWVCGHCRSNNDKTQEYSFLSCCQTCRAIPKAFRCDRCQKLLFLQPLSDEERLSYSENLAAYRVPEPAQAPATPEQVVAQVAAQRRTEREDIEHRIVMAELVAKLTERRKRIEVMLGSSRKEEPSARERAAQALAKSKDEQLAVYEIAREAKEDAKIKYKDDADLLEMHLAVIEDFVQKQIL